MAVSVWYSLLLYTELSDMTTRDSKTMGASLGKEPLGVTMIKIRNKYICTIVILKQFEE